MQLVTFEKGSFRDRGGRILHTADGRVLRSLEANMAGHWHTLEATTFFKAAVADGRMVATCESDLTAEQLGLPDRFEIVLEHEPIPVITYPYEWCFGMLREAALLQLELLSEALKEGMVCKDGTSYNVQWRGRRPQFIDTGSFEALGAGSIWTGYRQFCELFLYPLMLQAYRDVPFQPLLRGRLDGITPEMANNLFSGRDWLRRGVFTQVFLQALFQRKLADSPRNLQKEVRSTRFDKSLIENNVSRLRKLVEKLTWSPSGSEWGDYQDTHSYAEEEEAEKRRFVEAAAKHHAPDLVWDLGANTGRYSALAARHAGYVLALDIDQLAVERHFQRLRREGPDNILPLVANLADPSPALGWQLEERMPLERRSAPDLVLCLAVIHHVVITANVPLREFVGWLATLGANLVIEFVDRHDPMAERLLRNRDDVDDYDQDLFEQYLEASFTVEDRIEIGGGRRTLYRCVNRGDS